MRPYTRVYHDLLGRLFTKIRALQNLDHANFSNEARCVYNLNWLVNY